MGSREVSKVYKGKSELSLYCLLEHFTLVKLKVEKVGDQDQSGTFDRLGGVWPGRVMPHAQSSPSVCLDIDGQKHRTLVGCSSAWTAKHCGRCLS